MQGSAQLTSVRNAARLLKEFSRTDRELGVSELSRRLGLSTSTVHRMLATLTAERLLERGRSGRYRLGLALYDIGASVGGNLDLHEAALPVMAVLRADTGETVQLAVLDGLESVYIDRLESPHTVRIFARVGTRLPAPTTSTGKVMLAALPPEELDARLAAWTPQRITPYTIVDEAVLRARLREVAERGWAENREESRVGVVSVGAPVRDGSGAVIAALSVAAPTGRATPSALARLRSAVIAAAARASARLGARR
ncbi:transcriptional regulator, IclR family [Pseudonocardia thermophila]|jgi:Transcriptional regulator|uniref:Glycerol operon regulatory protein n=1 Tax=Pseudonocardia thermophila TaxID=1848 RepID=A0A1M6R7L2_PSETH|nr:IclR family transcriptional regulator [Pseudonocardia thermophila]SHK28317.1 transcriptional regulator, IclR family [Pseudonocardia thermophila]